MMHDTKEDVVSALCHAKCQSVKFIATDYKTSEPLFVLVSD